ncbi:hypothetical protein [Pedobacter sp. UBA5917]|jgi:hypothetical protein|uniref:hypothetical protein n=1 Tax=Pedobacter sp. UBA5917 TaxID=1947061 RepID=UPI0025E8B3E5|nr:hypothetical protein [Pedobacter sp. UBA5917]
MIRYWFEFKNYPKVPPGTRMGCGVTAFDYEDALAMLKEKVFNGGNLAHIICTKENIDISTLDANHVLPNIGLANKRGIWFPPGYDY